MDSKAVFFNPDTRVLRAGWRIPWMVLWIAPLFIAMFLLKKVALPHLPAPALQPVKLLIPLAMTAALLVVYRLFARTVEHRATPELAVDGDTPWHVGLGFLMGGGVMLIITGALYLAGCYHVAALNSPWVLLKDALFYLPQSFLEDLLFGLVLYRLLREGLGKGPALLSAPVLFALAHAGNSNESLLGLAEIVTAGCVMYVAFERTGSFWTIWALHFSWNFTMNGIFGLANSGGDLGGLIRPMVLGPTWLTGGATGPEASVLALGSDLLLLLLLWKMSDRSLRARRL